MNVPQERSLWAFPRFWIMHFERPWDGRFRLLDSHEIYLQTIWGRLWGFGRRLTTTAEGLIEPLQGLSIA